MGATAAEVSWFDADICKKPKPSPDGFLATAERDPGGARDRPSYYTVATDSLLLHRWPQGGARAWFSRASIIQQVQIQYTGRRR